LRPFIRGLEYAVVIVFPPGNWHCADAGGLGLDCWLFAGIVKIATHNATTVQIATKYFRIVVSPIRYWIKSPEMAHPHL
jgi:hypothetical protein